MEKRWAVECWGDIGVTDIFYTKKEAEAYFKDIRSGLDSSKYIISKDSIIDKNNPDNAVYLTELDKL
ncbi:hypothetical protein M3172_16070 [Mesobacillus subterraneus]|uniref:hypothetical protein n=1 Tax=Mesobacillus subterraneus TaxID=285983 RepID=UPI00203CA7FD|nr:hypothetical protein [Mesobacillus subterraneus]MCM3574714.1 hypothetical protein [Mesobacillus subterraneus]